MSLLRNLLADLVAKRLWPVAVALVVALVAAPLALKGGPTEETAAPTAQATPPAATKPLVSIADQAPRGGKGPIGRNPFKQKDVAPSATVSAAGSPAATVTVTRGTGTGGSSSGGSPSGGSPSGGSALTNLGVVPVGGGGSGTGTAKPKAQSTDSWHVDLRFGQDGKLENRADVPRLSPLPNAADPFFVFLGVLADGKTALFLVSSDAGATGDGTCLPTPQNCERVQLKAGETEFFDVTTPDGQVQQYQLDLVHVSRERSATTAVAAANRSRESTEGRQVLRQAVQTGQVEVGDLAYSRDLGLVVPSGRAASTGAELFGGYRVDLQFGAPEPLVKRYNLARLTPLPSVDIPTLLYLGVAEGDDKSRSALFLNPTGAAAGGDAVCDPTPEECQRVSLKQGQKATFDAQTLDGGDQSYQLSIDAITPLRLGSAEEARLARHRESPAGRVVLRRLIGEVGALVGDLTFSGATGTVGHASTAAASTDPASTDAATTGG